MKKTLIVYYTKTGSNKYLAERFAKTLNCDIEPIQPRINSHAVLILTSLLKLRVGLHQPVNDFSQYDTLVVCGPIWMGQLISPVRNFIKKYAKDFNDIYFATCCGSSDDKKDDNFGYATVFEKAEKEVQGKKLTCEAFPIPLVVPKDKQDDGELIMNTRLSDENFKGEILSRFENLVKKIKE